MQLLENWDPLNLPRGSVRALVMLALAGALWAILLQGRDVPAALGYAMLLVLGHYFGSRSARHLAADARPPLRLPRGTIRTLIVVGFILVAYKLWSDGRLDLEPAARQPGSAGPTHLPLFAALGALVGGFLVRKAADLVSRGKASAPRRWFENGKALLVLIAAALLVILSLHGSDDPLNQKLEAATAAMVIFYFGTRP
jgi:amino acid transporter